MTNAGLYVFYAALVAALVSFGMPLYRAWKASRAAEHDDR